MRCLVRRVSRACVRVDRQAVGEIGKGLLVYLGIEEGDQKDDVDWVLKKLLGIRIFDDSEGKMNESLRGEDGIMLISQFTLFGNLKKGFRPSFNRAAEPLVARRMFEEFKRRLQSEFEGAVAVGFFGEHMDIEAIDDGPVSLCWIPGSEDTEASRWLVVLFSRFELFTNERKVSRRVPEGKGSFTEYLPFA